MPLEPKMVFQFSRLAALFPGRYSRLSLVSVSKSFLKPTNMPREGGPTTHVASPVRMAYKKISAPYGVILVMKMGKANDTKKHKESEYGTNAVASHSLPNSLKFLRLLRLFFGIRLLILLFFLVFFGADPATVLASTDSPALDLQRWYQANMSVYFAACSNPCGDHADTLDGENHDVLKHV